MSDLVERLRIYASDDHERLCQGRYYDCSCGYDDKRDPLMIEAADEIKRLRNALLKIKRGSIWNCDIEAFIDAALAEEKPND